MFKNMEVRSVFPAVVATGYRRQYTTKLPAGQKGRRAPAAGQFFGWHQGEHWRFRCFLIAHEGDSVLCVSGLRPTCCRTSSGRAVGTRAPAHELLAELDRVLRYPKLQRYFHC